MEAVLPEVVEPIYNSKFLGIRQTEIIPLLLEGIRELDDRMQNDNKQAELDLLRSEIDSLKIRMKNLEQRTMCSLEGS